MALQDVFRDGGVTSAEIQDMILVQAKRIKEFENLSTEELWKLHTTYSVQSPLGQGVLAILKQRVPEEFK